MFAKVISRNYSPTRIFSKKVTLMKFFQKNRGGQFFKCAHCALGIFREINNVFLQPSQIIREFNGFPHSKGLFAQPISRIFREFNDFTLFVQPISRILS